MKRDAESHSSEDRKRRDEIDTKNQADNLVFQTRKQIKDIGDKMPAAVKSKVESAADALDAAIKGGNIADIKSKMEALNAVWNEASSQMYQQATAAGAPPPQGEPQPGPGPQQQQQSTNGKKVEDASFEVVDDKDKKN
jgi:molecular chaperone DnaK